jgi:hypothetical protein
MKDLERSRAEQAMVACALALGVGTLLAPRGARADDRPSPGLAALTLAIDGGAMARFLAWNDDLFGMLRSFTLAAAPSFGGEVTVFPGAFVTSGRPAWIGLAGRAEGIVGVTAQRSGYMAALPTQAWAFEASVRGRLPLRGSVVRGVAWIDAGAAGRAFTVEASGLTTPDVPSVTYLGPRVAIGGEAWLPRGVALSLHGGLARWIAAGDLTSSAWFRHARAWGADLSVRARVELPRGLAPYVDLAWSRDLAALRPQPGDALVAGGSADDRLSARVGLSWSLPAAEQRADHP